MLITNCLATVAMYLILKLQLCLKPNSYCEIIARVSTVQVSEYTELDATITCNDIGKDKSTLRYERFYLC